MQLANKTAIVTGASRGIGKAIAIELARAGAKVAVAARTAQPGQSRLPGTIYETVQEIEELGGRAIAVKCDVTEEKDVVELVQQVNRQYGIIDILVNNAGITTPESFLDMPAKKWNLVMSVNLGGTVCCTRAILPQMVEQKSGHIINLSSVLAKEVKFSIPYGVSKAAIERFTLGLAKEVRKHNIAVNALCPSWTVTEAVTAYVSATDTSGWQLPEMWGKYTVLVAGEDAQSLTGRILDEPALKESFGTI